MSGTNVGAPPAQGRAELGRDGERLWDPRKGGGHEVGAQPCG